MAAAVPCTVHGAIGKMLAWNYQRTGAEETVSAVRFLWGAQGPRDCAHGGQVASALDHCFGHCMRGVLGVGPQFTVRLRTELRRPVPLQRTLCCQVRIARKEVRPGREGKDGRMRVQLEASMREVEPKGSLGEVLVTGECTFVAFTNAAGALSKHMPAESPRLARQHELAEAAHRASPIVYDDIGRVLAPGPPMPYFSCRGGTARLWEPTRQWAEGSPEVARLLAEPGWIEMDVRFARQRFPPSGGRWVPSGLPAAVLEDLRAQGGDLPPAVSVMDNRVMECYFADSSGPRVIGALRFTRAAAGPPGRAHGGLVATALDEAFVWAGMHVGAGPTAWLDVSLRGAAPLETTVFVLAELEKAEATRSKRFKLNLRARIYQLKPEGLSAPGPIDEIVRSGSLLTEATTLLICPWLDPRWKSCITLDGSTRARL